MNDLKYSDIEGLSVFLKARKNLEEKEEKDNRFNKVISTLIKNSKAGYIKIRKVSENFGYLDKNGIVEGYFCIFCPEMALYIVNDDAWYHTSIIKSINWKNHKFYTVNSIYEFEIIEDIDYNKMLNLINEHEITSSNKET